MPEFQFSSGPAPFLDVPPIDVVTQQLLTESSRRNSLHSHHGVGNILDLFRAHNNNNLDEESTQSEDDDDFYDRISHTEQTPLRVNDLRNPLIATDYTNLQHQANLTGQDLDLISSYTRRNSLATLRNIKSHSTINYVISHGTVPEIETSTKAELKTLTKFSIPLIITFLLQYSLNVASVFSVGRIGKTELAAVSLAGMTANITGYCLFQGTSTSLDTLCAQAYGRKDYKTVGLHFLRCTLFLFLILIPVVLIWVYLSYPILSLLVDDEYLVHLASLYLQVSAIGLPGFILFETLKRYLQAQNIFHASTYVILFAAPFNAFLNYYLVWSKAFNLGFVGAPIAIVCTNYLMAGFLLLYTIFVDGYQCWCGFPKEIFKNWGKMVSLSINGCIGVLCEWLAFEILTLSAARFGTVVLASQSVIATICVLLYQIPFAISIATSTRVANFVGSASKVAALKATRASILISLIMGCFNCFLLFTYKYQIIGFFTNEPEVVELAAKILPIGALYQINDCLASVTGGVLRGQGRQKLAAAIGLVSYYVVALPIGFFLAFGYHMQLYGLWCGFIVAIVMISISQTYFVLRSNWEGIINESLKDALAEGHYSATNQSDLRSVISHSLMDAI